MFNMNDLKNLDFNKMIKNVSQGINFTWEKEEIKTDDEILIILNKYKIQNFKIIDINKKTFIFYMKLE